MQEDGVGGGVVQETPAQKASLPCFQVILQQSPFSKLILQQFNHPTRIQPASNPHPTRIQPIVGDDDHGLLPVLQKLFQPGHGMHVQVIRGLVQK